MLWISKRKLRKAHAAGYRLGRVTWIPQHGPFTTQKTAYENWAYEVGFRRGVSATWALRNVDGERQR